MKNELGLHDYRLTNYTSIERWWELIFSAYLLVSLHAEQFKQHQQRHLTQSAESIASTSVFNQHPDWEAGTNWKSALNTLRLLLQPYWCWAWLEAWLQVFSINNAAYRRS